MADVATTWFRLRELDTEVAIIERTIESQADTLELVRSLKRNGVASAPRSSRRCRDSLDACAVAARMQRRVQTENLLRFLIGYAPEPCLADGATGRRRARGNSGRPAGPAPRATAGPAAAREQLHSATANVGFAEASRFPYLSIGLTSFGLVSPELAVCSTATTGAGALFDRAVPRRPLYQSGRGTGNVEVARAQMKQAELAYRRGVLQAYREVADVLVVTDQGPDLIEQSSIRVEAAREVLRLQQMRYRAGVVSFLEVLDAERQFFLAGSSSPARA